jgi:hypothetical protein
VSKELYRELAGERRQRQGQRSVRPAVVARVGSCRIRSPSEAVVVPRPR